MIPCHPGERVKVPSTSALVAIATAFLIGYLIGGVVGVLSGEAYYENLYESQADIFYPWAFTWGEGSGIIRSHQVCEAQSLIVSLSGDGSINTSEKVEHKPSILTVWVNLTGDVTTTNLSRAKTWLLENLAVEVVNDPEGVPVYMTWRDIVVFDEEGLPQRNVAGVYVEKRGIAIETSQANYTDLIFAHELGHMLGLGHQESDPNGLMYPDADAGAPHLRFTTVSSGERAFVDRVNHVGYGNTWAARRCVGD